MAIASFPRNELLHRNEAQYLYYSCFVVIGHRLLRFHILWRVPGPVEYTAVLPRSPSTQYLASTSKDARAEIATTSKASADILKQLLDKIPNSIGREREALEELIESFETIGLQDATDHV